jgi:hypothetical protein
LESLVVEYGFAHVERKLLGEIFDMEGEMNKDCCHTVECRNIAYKNEHHAHAISTHRSKWGMYPPL